MVYNELELLNGEHSNRDTFYISPIIFYDLEGLIHGPNVERFCMYYCLYTFFNRIQIYVCRHVRVM